MERPRDFAPRLLDGAASMPKTVARNFLAEEKDLLAGVGGNTAPEGRDLALPLLTESQHQHLLIDVRVLAETAHRAAPALARTLNAARVC